MTVTNSVGNVTSNAATLTVNAATFLLNSSTSTLAFASVTLGSSKILGVAFTNAGTANVTMSSVTISGAGFSATGLSSDQILTPAQTATLNVTFTPATVAALSGSVTVTSNATNSPASISFTGTGVAVTDTPICGLNNDDASHISTEYNTFTPRPLAAATLTRLPVAPSGASQMTRSTRSTMLRSLRSVPMISTSPSYTPTDGGVDIRTTPAYYPTYTPGTIVVSQGNMPGDASGEDKWDLTNPLMFYYASGNSIMFRNSHRSARLYFHQQLHGHFSHGSPVHLL